MRDGRWDRIVLAVAVAFVVWWAFPLLAAGMDDIRMLLAFYHDEVILVDVIATALDERQYLLDYANYGQLGFNAALVPLAVAGTFSDVAFSDIAVTLRAVSLVAGAACAVAVYYWLRPSGRWGAVLGVVAIVSHLTILEYMVVAHPDIPELFFLAAGLAAVSAALARRSWPAARLGAACAGLAFACKFGGIALAPLVAAAAWRARPRVPPAAAAVVRRLRIALLATAVAAIVTGLTITAQRFAAGFTADGLVDPAGARLIDRVRLVLVSGGAAALTLAAIRAPFAWLALRPDLAHLVYRLAVAGGVAVAAFAAASPGSVWKFTVLKGLYFQATRFAPASPGESLGYLFEWSQMLAATTPPIVLVAAAVGAVASGARCVRDGLDALSDAGCVALVYLLTEAVMLSRITPGTPHYLIPVHLGMAGLAGAGLNAVARDVARRAGTRVAAAVSAVVIIAAIGASAPAIVSTREALAMRVERSDAVRLGRWMASALPNASFLLADYLSYVPADFADVTFVWGALPEWPERDPAFLVTNDGVQALAATSRFPASAAVAADKGYRLWLRCGASALHGRQPPDPAVWTLAAIPPHCAR